MDDSKNNVGKMLALLIVGLLFIAVGNLLIALIAPSRRCKMIATGMAAAGIMLVIGLAA